MQLVRGADWSSVVADTTHSPPPLATIFGVSILAVTIVAGIIYGGRVLLRRNKTRM